MADWLSSMAQTFEYYIVDPKTWKDSKKIENVKSCRITRDLNAETLGSASFEINEDIGEQYVRVYLITDQNGVREKFPLGTYLVQTPAISYNGKVQSISLDAYSPLLELKEKYPALGYSLYKNQNIMDIAGVLARENMRAPVIPTTNDTTLYYDFVADSDNTWLSYLQDLIANAKYVFDIDELGRILFSPKQEVSALQPVWTFNTDNSSILYPDIDIDRDLYGVPNVVEVCYSNGSNNKYTRVVNDDPNSPTSILNRGREIVYRDTTPNIVGSPTQAQIEEYAVKLLKDLSSLEYTVSYTHGYCPVRVGDAVRLNYPKAGLTNVKAKVVKQSISCVKGCPVTETAIFTNKLWR